MSSSSHHTTPSIPTYVERTDLPRILVRGKGGMIRYYAYVNGYIAGPKVRVRGMAAAPIYYLSLVDMSGDGGKLQGIYSALVSEPPQDVYLETVGTVVLAHRDPRFENLGYTIHWNYTQGTTADRDNNLHGVIESNMLTMCDPVAGSAPRVRERKRASKAAHAKQQKRKRAPGKIMLTTATKKDLGDLEERVNRSKHPLFLLMLPGIVVPDRLPTDTDETYAVRREQHVDPYLAEQHFAFLDFRVPQPLVIEWAPFLWQRALATQENTRLTVWFKPVVQGRDEQLEDEQRTDGEEAPPKTMPIIGEAWLCRPSIPLLDSDLKTALRDGRISNLCEEGMEMLPTLEVREAIPA